MVSYISYNGSMVLQSLTCKVKKFDVCLIVKRISSSFTHSSRFTWRNIPKTSIFRRSMNGINCSVMHTNDDWIENCVQFKNMVGQLHIAAIFTTDKSFLNFKEYFCDHKKLPVFGLCLFIHLPIYALQWNKCMLMIRAFKLGINLTFPCFGCCFGVGTLKVNHARVCYIKNSLQRKDRLRRIMCHVFDGLICLSVAKSVLIMQ